MSKCKEKGYHGTLTSNDANPWVCKDCGETGMCSICGRDKDEELKTDLYDFIGEQICGKCTEIEKPISDKLKSYGGTMTDRDFVRTILALEAENERLHKFNNDVKNILILFDPQPAYNKIRELCEELFQEQQDALSEDKLEE